VDQHKLKFVGRFMQFIKESFIRASPERVFAFHEQPDALNLLMPPWETSRLISQAKISEPGSRTIVEAKILGPFSLRWIAEHTIYDPPRMFEDIQISGPFRRWRHRHIVEPRGDGAILRDEIDYDPPLGFLGRLAAPFLIESRLRKLFAYRHKVTIEWCEADKRNGSER
jgi:ligand-binding SRPBCC domain-containing protein